MAVPAIGADPNKTWTGQGSSEPWLVTESRELLEETRVMFLDHGSPTEGENLDSLAGQFLDLLRGTRNHNVYQPKIPWHVGNWLETYTAYRKSEGLYFLYVTVLVDLWRKQHLFLTPNQRNPWYGPTALELRLCQLLTKDRATYGHQNLQKAFVL